MVCSEWNFLNEVKRRLLPILDNLLLGCFFININVVFGWNFKDKNIKEIFKLKYNIKDVKLSYLYFTFFPFN